MREARTLGSWVIALFLAVMLFWIAADTLAPQPPARNHLFEVFRDSSDIALFEPAGRFGFGVLEVLAALLILVPVTRRVGAILAVLVMGALAALVVQLMMLGVKVPVDTLGAAGTVTTVDTDPSALFYLIAALLAASVALVFIHPGKSNEKPAGYYGSRGRTGAT
jgi:hypothetical protein